MDSFSRLQHSGTDFPDDAFLGRALEYTRKCTNVSTVNHCLRSAAFALLFANKLPVLANVDKKLVVYSCIMHDLGWSNDETIISKDKRFEVDGANAARAWMTQHASALEWSSRETQLCWDAIALHTTPSIARYKEPEVAATSMGITADFLGPGFPGGLITVEEYKEIVTAFPREEFKDNLVQIMCGLCAHKADTTFDNFVSEFGIEFGPTGGNKEAYKKEAEEHSPIKRLLGGLDACKQYE